MWCLVVLVQGIVDTIASMMRIPLNEKVLVRCNILLMKRANSFRSVIPFEHPESHDMIHALREGTRGYPLSFVYTLAYSLRQAFSVLSIIAALFVIHMWLPLLVMVVALPHGFATILYEKQGWDLALFRSPRARRMSWLSQLTLDEKAIKEVRAYNFGSFLVERYQEASDEFLKETRPARWKIGLIGMGLSTLSISGNIALLLWIFNSITTTFTLEQAVISLQALVMAQQNLPQCMESIGMFSAPLLFFQKLRAFLTTNVPDFSTVAEMEPPDLIKEITFEKVSVLYPDGRQALKGIDFTIRQGETWALVGENGAGKSTIIKLLTRLYDPSEGRILVNGTDLRRLKIDAWRHKLSLVFQDYTNYSLTPTENIGLGDLALMAKQECIDKASAQAGFDKIAARLPKGHDTILGKEFGGTALSGGEWQKLAIARAFLRDGEILVLDEPSVALDPRAEYETYQQISKLAFNKTTIFVTHRLGSIKMADRIIVLKQGQIEEIGSHEQLLKKEGEYARLYHLQASRYDFRSKPNLALSKRAEESTCSL